MLFPSVNPVICFSTTVAQPTFLIPFLHPCPLSCSGDFPSFSASVQSSFIFFSIRFTPLFSRFVIILLSCFIITLGLPILRILLIQLYCKTTSFGLINVPEFFSCSLYSVGSGFTPPLCLLMLMAQYVYFSTSFSIFHYCICCGSSILLSHLKISSRCKCIHL